MKYIYILLILLPILSFGQLKKNEIGTETSMVEIQTFYPYGNFNPFEKFGIRYTRLISLKSSISLSYNRFNSLKGFGSLNPGIYILPCYYRGVYCIGKPSHIINYRFIDFYYNSKWNFNKKSHIQFGAGFSNAFGKNRVSDSLIWSQVPPFDNGELFSHVENVKYLGLLVRTAIKRQIITKNLYAGLSFTFRRYAKFEYSIFNYGINFSYNF